MYLYITQNDVNRIYDSLMLYVYVYGDFEELKKYTEEQIKKCLDDVCDIYYGHNFSIENIAELLIEFLADAF